MVKKLTSVLSLDDLDFIEKRYMYNWTGEDLAKEFNISLRTVYRKIDKLISTIFNFAIKNNWSLRFIESQIKNETWLKERFEKQIYDYFKAVNTKI